MTGSSPSVAVVIVTYNSGRVLDRCLDALRRQTRPADLVVIVDNNSSDRAYLQEVPTGPPFRLVLGSRNDGFCAGNNTGYALARSYKYVLFLNPDAFLMPDFIERALAAAELPENQDVGCMTGTLLGFDVALGRPSGLVDSTGIFQRAYGKWYDRDQGSSQNAISVHPAVEDVPAACGALMFCRTAALESVALSGHEIFDKRFFMYKEDIDLSLRLRARGWRVIYSSGLVCYHGRGWQGRAAMSYRAKYLSARNELRVCGRNRLRGLPYSLLKLAYVLTIERWRGQH